MASLVTVQKHENWVELILNRADKRNAIDAQLMKDLRTALGEIRDDPDAKVVVLKGDGRVFSSGIDHSLLLSVFEKSQSVPFRHLHKDLQDIIRTITEMEKPVVAALHGAAVGMGFELALAADFRVATADCILGLPEIAFGILPDVGGSTRLTQLVGAHKAKELILTGQFFTGKEALAWGAITRLAPDAAALDGEVQALVDALARHPAAAVGLGKVMLDRLADTPGSDALRLEGLYQSILLARPDINEHFMTALAYIQGEMQRVKKES